MEMNWYKSFVEDDVFSMKPKGIVETLPWPWQFFIGGKKVMEVFSCLSRRGRGRNERDSSQLPSILPVPLNAETHPG